MPAQTLLITKPLKYVDVFGLLEMMQKLNLDPVTGSWDPVNMLLSGPKGCGKTLLFAAFAQDARIPYVSVDCSSETRERHLKGGLVGGRGGETPFVYGAMANAIEAANRTGTAMLVFEEVNVLDSYQQKLINSLTDFRKKIELPEISLRLELNEDAALFVGATMNPSSYGDTYDLNPDLRSRFHEIEIQYPPAGAEKRILKETAPEGYQIDDRALDVLVRIAAESRQGATNYSLSTRDLVEALRILPRMGWQDTLFLLAQKFSGGDRALMLDRIKDITTYVIPPVLIERG